MNDGLKTGSDPAWWRADLHIHTCLSPCADREMVPTAIVTRAKTAGLDMIGVCDHNSTENAMAVALAGRRASLSVIPGIEITTCEEVHVLGLFVARSRFAELAKALHREGGRRVSPKMEDLSLHVLDIVENALTAAADRVRILIHEDTETDQLLLEIEDNGRGMDAALRQQVLDPFFSTKTARRVGLGLPLLAQAARESGGALELLSEPGRGTTVRAVFRRSHPDRKPLGDLAETLRTIMCSRPELGLRFDHTRDSEIIATLDTGGP